MAFETILSNFSIFFQMAMLIVMLVCSVGLVKECGRLLTSVFLTFSFAIYLLTDIYWVIYLFIRPNVRMPFAANEIGEASLFLLMASTLRAAVRVPYGASFKCTAGTILFSLCNIILWISWSGEYIQDILIGITFTYFLYTICTAIEFRQAFKRYMWIVMVICCILIVILQTTTFYTSDSSKNTIDTCAYILMLASVIFLIVLFILSWKKESSNVILCKIFVLLGFILTVKYMSDGVWYVLFQIIETISLAFLYLSVRKVVGKE